MTRFLADADLNEGIVTGCLRREPAMDFLHFGHFLQARGSSPGVLRVPQRLPVADAIQELILIWAASEAEEWANQIVAIPLP